MRARVLVAHWRRALSIFLYIILSAFFGSIGCWVYKAWIAALFPKTKTPSRKGGRANPVSGSDDAAGAGAGTGYDESWIPEHHKIKPVARRVNSGASAKKKGKQQGQSGSTE